MFVKVVSNLKLLRDNERSRNENVPHESQRARALFKCGRQCNHIQETDRVQLHCLLHSAWLSSSILDKTARPNSTPPKQCVQQMICDTDRKKGGLKHESALTVDELR